MDLLQNGTKLSDLDPIAEVPSSDLWFEIIYREDENSPYVNYRVNKETLLTALNQHDTNGKSAYELALENGFVGSEEEWLVSLVGPKGIDGKSAYQLALDAGFVGTSAEWLVSLQGQTGKSNYELAVDGGFIGTQAEYLASLKGDPGDPGQDGETVTITVRGALSDVESLPDPLTATQNDAYFINKHIWVLTDGVWIDGGDLSGPRGTDGLGLRILGTLTAVEFLPLTENAVGDAYIINYKMWVWDGAIWSPVGQVGPDGKSAYQVAVDLGFTGTRTQWLASLVGKSAYEQAVTEGFVGTFSDWIMTFKGEQGEKGDPGEKGDTGSPASIAILQGTVDNLVDLPTGADPGHAYLFGSDVYVWTGDEWFNAGPILGPKGDKGDKGDPGDIGPSGISAYEVAVVNGFTGTAVEWLASLVGADGLSAYDVWVNEGNVGTVNDFILSLKGEQGDRGLTGATGANLEIVGTVASEGDLPQSSTPGTAYVVGLNLFVWIIDQWVDVGPFQGPSGEDGKSAYQEAVDGGFVGTAADWLLSLKGDKGDKGDPGNSGLDAYQVAVNEGFAGTRAEWLASLKGTKGDPGTDGTPGTDGAPGQSAYQLAVSLGFVGTEAEWLESIRGTDGANLKIIGTLALESDLAGIVSPQTGDAYVINIDGFNVLFSWSGTEWVNLGDITGPQGPAGNDGNDGKSALELAAEQDPSITDVPTFLESIKGAPGDVGPSGPALTPMGHLDTLTDLTNVTGMENGHTYIVGDGELYIYNDGWVYMGNIQGIQGPEGPIGPGITILGKLTNSSELPGTGNLGDGYLIDGNFWGWTGSAYEDLGTIQGPEGPAGPKGDRGIQGLKGDPGEKGDVGTLWIVLSRDPQAIDGRLNDYFLNSSSLQFFKKTGETVWAPLGYLGGGNVYDAAADDKPYARYNNGWVELTVTEAPVDGLDYLRNNQAWRRFDRYTLNTQSLIGEIDLNTSQVFTVTADTNRTLSFSNVPANSRSMTVVITVIGNAGTITWPNGINWNNDTAPELSATYTTVILLWNNGQWYGGEGPKA